MQRLGPSSVLRNPANFTGVESYLTPDLFVKNKLFRGLWTNVTNAKDERSKVFKISARPINVRGIHTGRRIVKSKNTDIHHNLAVEDYLFNSTQQQDDVLMLWQNSPCVVIGRHQNPWTEANIKFLRENNIKLARRNSGGGTVYHDFGNLNLTFVTSKEKYNRRKNLELICSALQSLGIVAEINDRDDILLQGKKISGTAAKLTRNRSYHHCTLLVNADRSNLSAALRSPLSDLIKTNATSSVRSPVDNLASESRQVTVDEVEEALAIAFNSDCDVEVLEENFENEHVVKFGQELRSWTWIFGKTPKFTLEKNITLPNGGEVAMKSLIVKGCIESVSFDGKPIDLEIKSGLSFSLNSYLEIAQRLRGDEKDAVLELMKILQNVL